MSAINMENMTADTLKELLEKQSESLLEALGKMIEERLKISAASAPTAVASEKSSKKASKPKEPRAPSTNPWIHFTVRVEALIRAHEETMGVEKEKKMLTVRVKQFASDLKSRKDYDEWSDEDIVAALDGWEPPAVSKQASKKTDKSADADDAASSGSPEEKKKSGRKKLEDMSPEELAAHKQKVAERKAKKAAAEAAAAEPAAAEAAAAEPAAAEPAAAAPVKKAIKVKAKVPEEQKKIDLRFYSWSHGGQDYFTNERGDVLSAEFEWVGRFNGTEIDETVPEPADLENAEMKE